MESENSKLITMTITVMLTAILAGAILIPILADITKESVDIENDDASWIRLAYGTGTDYNVTVSNDGTDITVDTMSGTADDMLIYADNVMCMACKNGSLYVVKQDGENTARTDMGNNVTISSTEGTVTISDGVNTVTSTPSWSYYPDADGVYSTFANAGLKTEGHELAAFGSFAGVFAYNNIVIPDLGLVMQTEIEPEYVNEVKWGLEE